MMQFKSQSERDSQRESYSLTFPGDLAAESIQAWLRSTASALRFGTTGLFSLSRDSLVFETWATSSGITHRLLIPSNSAEYITSQLRTHGRGVTVAKDDSRPVVDWNAGSEVSLSRPMSPLQTGRDNEVAASLLGSIQPLQEGETVLIQWVLAPVQEPREASSAPANSGLLRSILFGNEAPSNDEVNSRKSKLSEANLLGIGRIVAKAGHPFRASQIVHRVESALSSANSAATRFSFKGRGARLISEANQAKTPKTFPAQFNINELSSIVGWPVGQSFIPGLLRSSSRQLFATSDVASEGRILGTSTYSGHERPIAMPYKFATRHMVVAGGSGTGKTAFLLNCLAQDVKNGYGAIVLDAGDSQSDETMFSGALQCIPPERVNDVIVMDVANESSSPVGFNVFNQTDPRTIADQFTHLFQNLFNDISGVWLPQLLFHGVYTLAAHGGLSFVDLPALLNPQTEEEKEWSRYIISGVKDPNIKTWWARWQAMDLSKQENRLEPLYNRVWQVLSRPEIINIIGQSESTFNIQEVLESNKILLVNLAGLSSDTAKIIGTLLMNSIWTAARRGKASKANYLYLDEFQVMVSSLSVRMDDLLSRARKHNLGLAMATQYYEEDVPREIRNAALNNALTKVIFRVASGEARLWNAEFDRDLDNRDFRNLSNYEAYVRVASETGVSDVSLTTLPPHKHLGTERAVREHSRRTYGRPLVDVVAERQTRRIAPQASAKKKKRPPIGIEEW